MINTQMFSDSSTFFNQGPFRYIGYIYGKVFQ